MTHISDFESYKKAFSSLWREGFLDSDQAVVQEIQKFLSGKIASSLNRVSLRGKSMEDLRSELVEAGFREVHVGQAGCDKLHFFFLHKDHGLVRLKPKGCDLSKRYPYGVKCVLGNAHDISYVNELFKVTDEGIPMPKGAQVSDGINLDPAQMGPFTTKEEWLGWVMRQVHVDLAE